MIFIHGVIMVVGLGLLVGAKTLGGTICFGLAALSSALGVAYEAGKTRRK